MHPSQFNVISSSKAQDSSNVKINNYVTYSYPWKRRKTLVKVDINEQIQKVYNTMLTNKSSRNDISWKSQFNSA